MRGTNKLAGLGTLLIFIGIFCFKALFQKTVSKTSTKIILAVSGILSIVGGVFVMIKAIKDI